MSSRKEKFITKCIIKYYRYKYSRNFQCEPAQEAWKKSLKIHIEEEAKLSIGKKAAFRSNVELWSCDKGELTLADSVFCNSGTVIVCRNKISIGEGTSIAPNVMIYDHDHDFRNHYEGFVLGEIEIGRHVWIGANTVILKGTKIGDYSVIGAGSVVSGEVPPNSILIQKRETSIRQYRSNSNLI